MKRREKISILLLAALFVGGCATTEPAKEEPKEVAETKPALAQEPVGPTTAPDVVTRYTVVNGDHLWGIAGRDMIYGNPYQWPLIYKNNTDRIKDADLIYPDQVLVIPQQASREEIDAAINHAKTRGAWSLGAAEDSDLAYLGR